MGQRQVSSVSVVKYCAPYILRELGMTYKSMTDQQIFLTCKVKITFGDWGMRACMCAYVREFKQLKL